MYYIAYGSNLNKEEMKQRCKDAKFVLDEYEDYPYLYDCFEEKVLLENNETISGFIYQMYDRFPICKPSDSYMERCKQGYRDMGWDSSILDF